MEIRNFPYLIGTRLRRRPDALWLAFVLTAVGCAGGGVGQRVETVPAAPAETAAVPAPTPPVAPAGDGSAPAGVYHQVERGQTLWRISKVYGVDIEALAAANGIADSARLETGRVLFVPGAREPLHVPPYPAPLEQALPLRDPASLPPPTRAGTDGWLWPVEGGEIISAYGAPRRSHRHRGIDIRGWHGQTVLASREGRVTYSGSNMRGYGKTVIIEHGDGLHTLYAHNSALLVDRGDTVERGQPIARVGRSGNASGVHCHFEIRHEDRTVDPLLYLGGDREARR